MAAVNISPPPTAQPQNNVLKSVTGQRLTRRIIARLAKSDSEDGNVARLTVKYAFEGHPDPWRFAFWMCYGLVPEKLIPYFVARDIANHTDNFPASLLPLHFNRYWPETFAAGMAMSRIELVALPPKKPCHSALVVSTGRMMEVFLRAHPHARKIA